MDRPVNGVTALIDLEASGLHGESYPIELGWALPDTGEVGSVLIAPPPSWTPEQWDSAAEQIHGLSRADLFRDGVPPEAAVERFLTAVRGRHLLYCDGLATDRVWLERLFEAAGRRDYRITMRGHGAGPGFRLRDVADLYAALAPARVIDRERARRDADTGPSIHRGGPDAARLMALLHRIQRARR